MFFINELCAEIYFLLFNILFFHLWGLNGLGLSFIVNYLLYYIQCTIVCHKRYNYIIDVSVLHFFAPQFLISLIILLIVILLPSTYKYTIGFPLVALSTYLSYRELQRRFNVTDYIRSKIGIFHKR